jgi:hypothetical protein
VAIGIFDLAISRFHLFQTGIGISNLKMSKSEIRNWLLDFDKVKLTTEASVKNKNNVV